MIHREKLSEAKFNLKSLQESFFRGDNNFEHCLNNFLTSAQSIIHTLNQSFSKSPGYNTWMDQRTERLPEDSKIFKELRNISLKEASVRSESVTVQFDFSKIKVLPGAKIISPVYDSWTNQIIGKGSMTTRDGSNIELSPDVTRDFNVKVISNGKIYSIEKFIARANNYLEALEEEIKKTESKF